ncbi:MAG: hypothetical protein IJ849_08675 [Selenomonadaceae bacterium]|nr:hypothetical protein [Selenomonadaceae bacterium]
MGRVHVRRNEINGRCWRCGAKELTVTWIGGREPQVAVGCPKCGLHSLGTAVPEALARWNGLAGVKGQKFWWLTGGLALGSLLSFFFSPVLMLLPLAGCAGWNFFRAKQAQKFYLTENQLPSPETDSETSELELSAPDLARRTHATLTAVTENIERVSVTAAVKASRRFVKAVTRAAGIDSRAAVNQHRLYTEELVNILDKLTKDRKLLAASNEGLDQACRAYADFCQRLCLSLKGAAVEDVRVDLKVFTDVLNGGGEHARLRDGV